MNNRLFSFGFALLLTASGLTFSPSGTYAKTVKECDAEYKTNKAAIQASGEKKKDFVTRCRADTAAVTAPLSKTAAPQQAPAEAQKPAAAPAPARRQNLYHTRQHQLRPASLLPKPRPRRIAQAIPWSGPTPKQISIISPARIITGTPGPVPICAKAKRPQRVSVRRKTRNIRKGKPRRFNTDARLQLLGTQL
jgi:hypothetical protein